LDKKDIRRLCLMNKRLEIFCQEDWIKNKILDLKIFPGRIVSVIKAEKSFIFGESKYIIPNLEFNPPRNFLEKKSPFVRAKSLGNRKLGGLYEVILPDYMGVPVGAFSLEEDCYFVYNENGELFAIGTGRFGGLGTGSKGNRRKWTKIKGIKGKVVDLKARVVRKPPPRNWGAVKYNQVQALTEEGDLYFWGIYDVYRNTREVLSPELLKTEKRWIDYDFKHLIDEKGEVYLWIIGTQKFKRTAISAKDDGKIIQVANRTYLDTNGKVFYFVEGYVPITHKLVPTEHKEIAEESPTLLYGTPPKQVLLSKLPLKERIIAIGGTRTKVYLTENGEVYTQGTITGVLGYRIGSLYEGKLQTPLPTLVELPGFVRYLSTNEISVGVITKDNRIFSWGHFTSTSFPTRYPHEIIV